MQILLRKVHLKTSVATSFSREDVLLRQDNPQTSLLGFHKELFPSDVTNTGNGPQQGLRIILSNRDMFLERHVAVEMFKCNCPMLWGPSIIILIIINYYFLHLNWPVWWKCQNLGKYINEELLETWPFKPSLVSIHDFSDKMQFFSSIIMHSISDIILTEIPLGCAVISRVNKRSGVHEATGTSNWVTSDCQQHLPDSSLPVQCLPGL